MTRHFSRQIVTLVSPFIYLPFEFETLDDIMVPVTLQLAVRDHF